MRVFVLFFMAAVSLGLLIHPGDAFAEETILDFDAVMDNVMTSGIWSIVAGFGWLPEGFEVDGLDPATADINGGLYSFFEDPSSATPNGILDSDEFALFAAILADPTFDCTATGGTSHDAIYAAWTHNYNESYLDLGGGVGGPEVLINPGSMIPDAQYLFPAFIMLGDLDSLDFPIMILSLAVEDPFVSSFISDPNLSVPEMDSFILLPQFLAWCGDADGDGCSNLHEYEAYYPGGGRAAYIAAALDPAVSPGGCINDIPCQTGVPSVVQWTFDVDAEGWTLPHATGANLRVEDGLFKWDYVSGNPFDPMIHRAYVRVDADVSVYLITELDIAAQPGAGPQDCQLFFNNGSGFAGGDPFREFDVPFSVLPNVGLLKTVTHAPTATADWHSMVTELRLDPGRNEADLAGYSGAMDRIALAPASFFASDPYIWDFESGDHAWNAVDPNGSNSVTVHSGNLEVTYGDPGPNPFDPFVENVWPVFFEASGLRYLRFDAAMTHSNNDAVGVRIQFEKSDGSIGESVVQIMPNAGTRTYMLDMAASTQVQGPDASWTGLGTVTSLRIDPGDQQGTAGAFDAPTFAASEMRIGFISLTDGSGDADGDNLTDADEFNLYGTNPGRADSDGDGVNDDVEIRYHTDPNSPAEWPELPAASPLAGGLIVLLLMLAAAHALSRRPSASW